MLVRRQLPDISFKKMRYLAFWVFLAFYSGVFAQAEQFTCPMHPHYIASEAGPCPICGMDLVKIQAEEDTSGGAEDENENPRKAITISPETIQNIGVRSEPAEVAFFGRGIRSFGLVTENKRTRYAITGRVAGWVEALSVTAVGDFVASGEQLFELYSPELISAQQDYIAALATKSRPRIRSSAQRLTSMGVSEQVLKRLKKTRKKLERVPFYATKSGVVSELMITEGSYIQPGTPIANIQDYQHVWVNASVAEKDLQFISQDTKTVVTFPNIGNVDVAATVDYIYPTIEKSSRTGKVRIVLDNSEGLLRPGAYADIVFETETEKRLSVASEAILRSAEGNYVVIARGDGRFLPQLVETGIRHKGRTEILKGISEGENVVVSSQFLIDSESSLRESFRKLALAQKPLSQLTVNNNQLAMIDHLIDAALYLHKAQTQQINMLPRMLQPALELNAHLMPDFRGTKLEYVLTEAAGAISDAQAAMTNTQRLNALAALVNSLKPWVLEGKPAYYRGKGLKLYLDHGTGNYWLQLAGEPVHPYGDGHAVEVMIPESVEDLSEKEAPQQMMGGAHAHH